MTQPAGDREWLWAVRVACLVSPLLISAPALVLQPVHWIAAWPFWLPYLLILLLVRNETLLIGLAWAMGTGLAALLVALARLVWTLGWTPPAAHHRVDRLHDDISRHRLSRL